MLLATVDDVPPPSAVAPLEGRLLLSIGRQARGLRSLLVPSYRGGRLIGGLLCGARLVGSGQRSLSLTGFFMCFLDLASCHVVGDGVTNAFERLDEIVYSFELSPAVLACFLGQLGQDILWNVDKFGWETRLVGL